jgi:hypothetical protein
MAKQAQVREELRQGYFAFAAGKPCGMQRRKNLMICGLSAKTVKH